MVDFRNPQYQFPYRKPVGPPPDASMKLKPVAQMVPDGHQQHRDMSPATAAHNRSRTASSSVLPLVGPPPNVSTAQYATAPRAYPHVAPQQKQTSRRTLSNATASTSTSGTGGGLAPVRSTSTSYSLRRSTSSRSAGAPAGYVALMRRQKATVWCDHSQYEDPRLLAQQKAARVRAAREVVGGPGRLSTGGSASLTTGTAGSRAKIRHGKSTMVDYTTASFVGGVPMRLSASEVGDEGNSDEEADSQYAPDAHRRTSSLGSGRLMSQMDGGRASNSHAHVPAAGRFGDVGVPFGGAGGADGAYDSGITPMPHHYQHHHHHHQPDDAHPGDGYFARPGGTGGSGGSGSSVDRENSFGDVGQIVPSSQQAPKSSAIVREKSYRTTDELRRRGSVDDRTMTMSGVKLFVANPD